MKYDYDHSYTVELLNADGQFRQRFKHLKLYVLASFSRKAHRIGNCKKYNSLCFSGIRMVMHETMMNNVLA
jgi:hypothetical protein